MCKEPFLMFPSDLDCSIIRPQTEQQEQMTNLKEHHLTMSEQQRDPKTATLLSVNSSF